uniref:NAD(P)H-dependent flavin oxidoreductase n=1 Tax=Amphritea sp. TaxID=1872502 RepID=UPI003D0E79CA
MDITQLFGIELPLIQAPMAGAQDAALAIAVSNAGGLGSLPCAMLSPEQLRSELDTIRAATDKPVNLNFFAHT